MRALVIGGARSGKSAHAERLLAEQSEVTYVATGGGRFDDPEWRARVRAHQRRRPPSWHTRETTDLPGALRAARTPLLVDCLTVWLTTVMDECEAWDDDVPYERAEANVTGRVDELVEAWRAVTVPVVAVTNEVGTGIVPATISGRRFRDAMGTLNTRVAAESDQVLLVVAGRVVRL